MIILLFTCSKDSRVVIQIEKDKVMVNEAFIASICLNDFNMDIGPEFYIINKIDTIRIISNKLNCKHSGEYG